MIRMQCIHSCSACRSDSIDGQLDDESPAKSAGRYKAVVEVFGEDGLIHLKTGLQGMAAHDFMDRVIILWQ